MSRYGKRSNLGPGSGGATKRALPRPRPNLAFKPRQAVGDRKNSRAFHPADSFPSERHGARIHKANDIRSRNRLNIMFPGITTRSGKIERQLLRLISPTFCHRRPRASRYKLRQFAPCLISLQSLSLRSLPENRAERGTRARLRSGMYATDGRRFFDLSLDEKDANSS